MCECAVPGGALNLNSTNYSDHGGYGDLPLHGKIPTAEPGIEPRTSWLVVRSCDHQATRPRGHEAGQQVENKLSFLLLLLLKVVQ
jgi:hypothetical protein